MVLAYGLVQVGPDWHVHEKNAPGYSRIYWIHAGTADYCDEQGQQTLLPNRLYLLPSSQPYTMRYNPQSPLYCCFIHLDVSPCSIPVLTELSPEEPLLSHLLAALELAVQEQEPPLVQAVSTALELCFQQQGLFERPDPALREVLDYITLHFREAPGIPELSRLAGYNPQYFIRFFKKKMGVTPHRYLFNCRMKEAARLLRTPTPISAIAGTIGYADIKSFEQAFKHQFGQSPGNWRRAYSLQP